MPLARSTAACLLLSAAACSGHHVPDAAVAELPIVALPWLHPAEAGDLAGTVRDAAGVGLAGARVCAWHHAPDLLREADRAPRCVNSGPGGAFAMPGLPPAVYLVHASAATFQPARHPRPVVVHADMVHLSVDLALAPGGVRLDGQVVDVRGAPIAGASLVNLDVAGWHAGDAAAAAATSDAEGRFTLWLAPGRQRLYTTAAEHTPSAIDVDPGGAPVRVTLGPGSGVTGTVVDLATGAPIADARVQVVTAGSNNTLVDTVYADAAGAYRVSRLPPGRYMLRAEAGNRHGEADRTVVLGLGQSLALPPIAAGSRPGLQARVSGCPQGRVIHHWAGTSEAVAYDGAVFVPTLEPGERTLTVQCPGRADVEYTVDVAAAPLTDLSWQAGPPGAPEPPRPAAAGGELRGVVTGSDGLPARDVAVTRIGADAKPVDRATDAAGIFVFPAVEPGEYTLIARDPDIRELPDVMPADAAARVSVVDGAVVDVRLRYPGATAAITGRVVRAGAAVAGAVVGSQRERRGNPPHPRFAWDRLDAVTVADADGRFTLPGGFVGSIHTLWAYPPGGGDGTRTGVAAGADTTVDVPLTAAVAGTFAAPLAPRFVVGVFAGDDTGVEPRVFDRTGGRWGFEDVAPGARDVLLLSTSGCAAARVELVPGERRADIALAPGELGGLRGRVRDGRRPVADGEVTVLAADPRYAALERMLPARVARTDVDGRFEVRGLCPGTFVVVAGTAADSARERVDVAPRAVAELELVLGDAAAAD